MKRLIPTILLCAFSSLCAGARNRPEPFLLFNQKDIEIQALKNSVQGTAIFGNYLFSFRDKGYCVVIDPSDRFPLLYVSQCKSEPVSELNRPECASLSRLLFVERVICNEEGTPVGTSLVQAISYQPRSWSSRLFVFDRTTPDRNGKYLICTTNSSGRVRPVYSFPLAAFSLVRR